MLDSSPASCYVAPGSAKTSITIMNSVVTKRDLLFAMLSEGQKHNFATVQQALQDDPTCLDHDSCEETKDED